MPLDAFFKINIRLNHIIFYDIIRLENLQKKYYTGKQSHIRNRLNFNGISHFNIK